MFAREICTVVKKYCCVSHGIRTFVTTCLGRQQEAPLEGIRVLDLTRVLAGPYCSMILGDWGAEVIKVEQPMKGDETRSWGPPFCGTESAYFLSINRNKKSITVNFKHPEGQNILKKLVSQCDVLIENYIPGSLSRYGLAYEDLRSDHPSLVYCSLTGFGQTGPLAHRAGYDVVAAAIGGLLHITGPEDGEPCRVGVAMTDLSTGLYACGAIMAALLKRNRTGKGVHIDCNLLSTQVATLSHIGSNYLNANVEAHRHGTGHFSIVPYQAFETLDGAYIIIGAGNNEQFAVVCQKVDLEELLLKKEYRNNSDRVTNRQELIKLLSDKFKRKTLSDWLNIFEGSGVPYGPVNNIPQVFANEQVEHSGLIQSFDHPTCGSVRVPGPAVKYSDYEICVKQAPPTLGQHTHQILSELLGYDDRSIQDFKDSGVL